MGKFLDAFMGTFLVTAILVILLLVGAGLYQATHPAEMIQRRDKACHNGCQTSHNPDLCYQACMYRE